MFMTEFIRTINNMPAEYKKMVQNWVVNDNSSHCPITAVCLYKTGKDFGCGMAEEAGADLGLTKEQSDAIISAADRPLGSLGAKLAKLRRSMVKAATSPKGTL